MNKPQSTIGAVEADVVERQHRDQLFSLDRLCARGSPAEDLETAAPSLVPSETGDSRSKFRVK
jgi:hypothetical protein